MQNQMKNQPLFALVPVPYEALVDAGIEIGDPLQFTVEEGKITMERLVPEEIAGTARTARCSCSTVLAAAKPVPVRIIVKEARCDNYDPDVPNPW